MHNITNDDAMAYRESGGRPWHGMGTPVPDETTDEEFFKASGLDWRVVEMPVMVQGSRESRPASNYKALVRSTDGKILSVVSKDYRPIQNQRIWEFFERFTNVGDMSLETAGSLAGGTVVWALAKLSGQGTSFTIPGTADRTDGYVLFSTGHKPGFATQVELTSVRVVCHNTLSMARDSKQGYRYRLTHLAKWTEDTEEAARQIVMDGVESMSEYGSEAHRLYNTPVNADIETAFLSELLAPQVFAAAVAGERKTLRELAADHHQAIGQGVLAEILEQDGEKPDTGKRLVELAVSAAAKGKMPATRLVKRVQDAIVNQPGVSGVDGTAWGMLQGVTYYVDHERGRSPSSAINSALFGDGAELKAKAYKLARTYADRLGTQKT